jgi:hypothetical protein
MRKVGSTMPQAPTFSKKDLLFHVAKGRDVVAISLSEYRGRKRVDIRQYFCYQDEDDVFGPTRQGVQLDPTTWTKFKKAMDAFEKANKKDLE